MKTFITLDLGNGYQTGVNYDRLRDELGQGQSYTTFYDRNLRIFAIS